MRMVLVFPPGAGATYVPLGVACLAPYIERALPGTRVPVMDLSIETWHVLAGQDPQGRDLLDFVQGRTGNFLDIDRTFACKPIWDRLRRRMTEFGRQAGVFAETGDTGAEYHALLKRQAEQVLSSDPSLVGFSILFPEQLPFAAALSRAVRQAWRPEAKGSPGSPETSDHPGLKIVWGGAMMSAIHVEELMSACPYIDGVVSGEGEMAAEALASGTHWNLVPGLIHRGACGLRVNAGVQTLSLKSLPKPDFSRLPLSLYFNPGTVLPVLFSRGCAWRKCRFCSHNFSFAGYRKKSAAAFVDEIERDHTDLGVRHFYSSDEYIAPSDMDAIALEIKARGLDIAYHALGKPIEACTAERMALWASSGCRWMGWGVESGSQRLLDLINKGTRVTVMAQVLRDAAEAGISNMALMIFGLPTSTDADLFETFGFLEQTYGYLDAMSASAFVLFEGTHFARNPGRYGLHVLGAEPVLQGNGRSVHSRRLRFRETASDGSLRTPRGALEAAQWARHRRWLGDDPFLEQIPCEHYLIHAAGSKSLTPLGTPETVPA